MKQVFAAYYIARNFERPVQIHAPEDFLSPLFVQRDPHNKWKKRIAKYVLRRVQSVRTNTDALKETLAKKYKKVVDIDTLPKFYNFKGLREAVPALNIHDKYKDFAFIMLAFGPLTADSHLHDTFTALHGTLMNKKIGLVVVGEGPAKNLFEEKVELLSIKESVVFISQLGDLVSYMKTADALIHTDVSEDSEQYVLKAAAAGLPIVTYETELRKDFV